MWSYRLASENLQEFCGISLSYTLLGTLAEQIAQEIEESLQHNPDIKKVFSMPKGQRNFMSMVRSFTYVVKMVKPNGTR